MRNITDEDIEKELKGKIEKANNPYEQTSKI